MNEQLVHLLGGGLGASAGAVATFPLAVLKTRLQSSGCASIFHFEPQPGPCSPSGACGVLQFGGHNGVGNSYKRWRNWQAWRFVQLSQQIRQKEGMGAFFKGLGPNLIGVAPSRAIYFCAYSWLKSCLTVRFTADSTQVHIFSASCAGLFVATATNPISLVKTRLQLDCGAGDKRLTLLRCIQNVYKESGLRGFYKGVQASYLGIGETVIHFVIYERLKLLLVPDNHQSGPNFLRFTACGAMARLVSALVAYPHEVVRTRLREEGTKYKRLVQTVVLISREEGMNAFYRGLGVHLIRTIPNTAIMMSTYEFVVYLCLH